jgi:uncharacterized protein (DUF2336 family)
MIVRQFLSWVRTAPASERAEATRALARAYLISDLSPDDRLAAEGALLMLLDDVSPLVRQAMAQVFARSIDAPSTIVHALACDHSSVSAPVLEYSPLLIDADLVDMFATADATAQAAIARRAGLPVHVSAAIAEVGSAEACLELLENPEAELVVVSLDRIVARFGHLAAIRETLLMRDDLPARTRLALAEKLSESLAGFVVSRDWLSSDRAEQVHADMRARVSVEVAARSNGADLQSLVAHLRESGQLTPSLILRSLLCGNLDLFEATLANLSGMPLDRVGAILSDRSGTSLNALLTRAGLPVSTIPAFREALAAMEEIDFADSLGSSMRMRLRRRMVERVLTRCGEIDDESIEPLLALLRRFATEAAREEARLFCEELVADDGLGPLTDETRARKQALIAA